MEMGRRMKPAGDTAREGRDGPVTPPVSMRGVGAALIVGMVWSGWIVLSRSGVQGSFSIWDLGLLRFGTAAVAVLGIALWRGQGILPLFAPRVALPALACGSVYVLLSFAALRQSAAANAGVVVNGLMPLATIILMMALVRRRPTPFDGIVGVILLAANMVILQGGLIGWSSFALFVGATFALAFYMVVVRAWALDPTVFFFAVPIVNAAVMVPLWWAFDGGISGPVAGIALQAGYQGILVTLGAVTLLTYAIRQIGSVAASMIMAAVPVTTAVLAFVVLGEPLTVLHIAALTICTAGIGLHVGNSRA